MRRRFSSEFFVVFLVVDGVRLNVGSEFLRVVFVFVLDLTSGVRLD